MKKLKILLTCATLLVLIVLPFSEVNAGEKSGESYSYELLEGDGSSFGTITVGTCDPCGWLRNLLNCRCYTWTKCEGPCGKNIPDQ